KNIRRMRDCKCARRQQSGARRTRCRARKGIRWCCFLSLTCVTNADKMSAMKTFTVRELDRVPNAVLDASDRDGAAKIRRRDGRTYTLRPDAGPSRITALP